MCWSPSGQAPVWQKRHWGWHVKLGSREDHACETSGKLPSHSSMLKGRPDDELRQVGKTCSHQVRELGRPGMGVNCGPVIGAHYHFPGPQSPSRRSQARQKREGIHLSGLLVGASETGSDSGASQPWQPAEQTEADFGWVYDAVFGNSTRSCVSDATAIWAHVSGARSLADFCDDDDDDDDDDDADAGELVCLGEPSWGTRCSLTDPFRGSVNGTSVVDNEPVKMRPGAETRYRHRSRSHRQTRPTGIPRHWSDQGPWTIPDIRLSITIRLSSQPPTDAGLQVPRLVDPVPSRPAQKAGKTWKSSRMAKRPSDAEMSVCEVALVCNRKPPQTYPMLDFHSAPRDWANLKCPNVCLLSFVL
ncbi:unnamed protein product [Protopolystoma xenopodis]|uniref:Uncharacterized protein n=1 Tax=Protopolystoma xenopodis TaxID=117903 RepID=A0A3S5BL94_9PLAT|nr:unnamed protein product [Protopolystoma xenopodis]